jgi:hypothetical protein
MEETKKDEEFEQVVKNVPTPVIPKEAIKTGDKGRVEKKKNKEVVLKNVKGEKMDEADYFYGGKAFPTFNQDCGFPVEREDLLEAFNKIFDPKDDILFYKAADKEVYLIIIPLKMSSSVSESNESLTGDFQKHAISFLQEGSVNLETLKMKLKRIIPFVKFADR